MGGLRIQDFKAHRARFRAMGSHPMPDGFLGVFRHQGLELTFCRSWSRKASRVLRKVAANSAQEFDELISTMRIASIRGRGGST